MGTILNELKKLNPILLFLLILWIFYNSRESFQNLNPIRSQNQLNTCPAQTFTKEIKFSPAILWTSDATCLKDSASDDDHDHHKKIVIIVSSARSNFERRRLIRRTWGSIRRYKNWSVSSLVFILGKAPQSKNPTLKASEIKIELQLQEEQNSFGDLVLADFVDTYRNLVLKTIGGFKWVKEFCPQVKIIVKCDDDVVVNVIRLIKILIENPSIEQSRNCYGRTCSHSQPIRDPTHRWFVSQAEWPETTFPLFCLGFGVVMTMDLITVILNELDYFEQLVPIEDTFILGIVPRSFNRRRESIDLENKFKFKPLGFINKSDEWCFDVSMDETRVRKWYQNQSDLQVLENDDGIFYLLPHSPHFESHVIGIWNKLMKIELP